MTRLLAPAFLLFVAPQALPQNALAQNGTVQNGLAQNPAANLPLAGGAATPSTVRAGLPSVLILALDDLATSTTNLPILAPEAPPAENLAPVAPILPLPPAPNPQPQNVAPIAPIGFAPPVPNATVRWQALAQRPPKPDKDAGLFLPLPDRGGIVAPPAQTAPTAPRAVTPPVELPAPSPPGRAGLTAIGLRRALLARGFGDVQTASPDAAIISRALGEKRLSLRVLDDLKRGMFALAQTTPPAPATLSGLARSVSRIGQAVGYRAVVVLYVGEIAGEKEKTAPFTLFWADAQNEVGEPIAFDEKGADEATLRENAALAGAAFLAKSLGELGPVSADTRATLAQKHFLTARGAQEAGRTPIATDEINQAIALDEKRADFWVLKGQILETADPEASAGAFRRAVELNARDGESWARLAKAYAYAKSPSFPQALEAGRKALAAGYDSPDLRVAMASAQYGRASLFRKADRVERAEEAEIEARSHLDRALEMAPDDPAAIRILARALLTNRNFDEAIQTLDRVAPRFPKDAELQSLYANTLVGLPASRARQEDAFLASARVWRLTAQTQVELDPITYRMLAEGFDLHISSLGRTAAQLTSGVAAGTLAQESAYLQLTKLTEEMKNAASAINAMRVSTGANADAITARQFAADLMSQALDAQSAFLETGQKLYRERGLSLTQNAVTQLNAARTAG